MLFTRSRAYWSQEVENSEIESIGQPILVRFNHIIPEGESVSAKDILKIVRTPGQKEYVYDLSYLERYNISKEKLAKVMKELFECSPLENKAKS